MPKRQRSAATRTEDTGMPDSMLPALFLTRNKDQIFECPLCPWDPVPERALVPVGVPHAYEEHLRTVHDIVDETRCHRTATGAAVSAMDRTSAVMTDEQVLTMMHAAAKAGGPPVLFCQDCDASMGSVDEVRAHILVCRGSARRTRHRTGKFPGTEVLASRTPAATGTTAKGRTIRLQSTVAQRQLHGRHSKPKTTRPKRFTCAVCSEMFTSRYDLGRHENRVHSGRPKKHMCDGCGAGFSQKSQLTMHQQRVHGLAKGQSSASASWSASASAAAAAAATARNARTHAAELRSADVKGEPVQTREEATSNATDSVSGHDRDSYEPPRSSENSVALELGTDENRNSPPLGTEARHEKRKIDGSPWKRNPEQHNNEVLADSSISADEEAKSKTN